MSDHFDHHIAELLQKHDCVIIPDFGGFVGNYASAKINPINNRFEPPYRKITFNKLLTHNDGLLASYVAQKLGIDFNQAREKLNGYTVLLSNQLKENKQITFDRIGVLSMNKDGAYRFEQVKDSAFFTDGFGLEAFYGKKIQRKLATPTAIEPKAERKTTVVTPKPAKTEEEKPKLIELAREEKPVEEPHIVAEPKGKQKRVVYWPAAAAVLLLSFIGYVIWFIVGTETLENPQNFQTSDLNPFSEKKCPEYALRDSQFKLNDLDEPIKIDWETAKKNEDVVEVYSREGKDKTLVVSLEEKVELAVKVEQNLPFHIIGGCFSDIRYANAMVSKFQKRGSTASIIDKKGILNRVSIARFATKKEAKQALASFRKDIPNAWVLYK